MLQMLLLLSLSLLVVLLFFLLLLRIALPLFGILHLFTFLFPSLYFFLLFFFCLFFRGGGGYKITFFILARSQGNVSRACQDPITFPSPTTPSHTHTPSVEDCTSALPHSDSVSGLSERADRPVHLDSIHLASLAFTRVTHSTDLTQLHWPGK